MQGKTKKEYKCISYLELYEDNIAPRLKEIDLLVKTSDGEITPYEAANVLYITQDEVKEIMCELSLNSIDRINFFMIMERGSSNICKMYQRELERKSPYIYTRGDISYIYQIEPGIIEKTCDTLGMNKITMLTLPTLLAHIPVYIPTNI